MRSVRRQEFPKPAVVFMPGMCWTAYSRTGGSGSPELLFAFQSPATKRHNFPRCRHTFEGLHFEAGELAKYRYGCFAIEQIFPEYLDQDVRRHKGIHREEHRKALGTLSTPRIGSISVAALEQFKELRKIRKQSSDLKFIERTDEAEVLRRGDRGTSAGTDQKELRIGNSSNTDD